MQNVEDLIPGEIERGPARRLTSTRTFVELEISPAAYGEVRGLLEAAGYQHAFVDDRAIDMHGIGLVPGDVRPDVGADPMMAWPFPGLEGSSRADHVARILANPAQALEAWEADLLTWEQDRRTLSVLRSRPQPSGGVPVQGVVFILRDRDGRVLMEQCPKKKARHGAEWFIPGGRMEAGEVSPREALQREMGEELGCYPAVAVELPIIDACGGPGWPSFLLQPYLVTEWDGEVPAHVLDHAAVPLRWFPFAEAAVSPSRVIRAMLAAAGGV